MPVKEDELSPKQQAFINALFGEARGKYRLAMDMAGYSKGTKVCQVLQHPKVKEAISESVQDHLAANGPGAVFTFEDVLENPTAPGNREKIKVATEILDRIGLGKMERKQVEVVGPQPVVILPAKDLTDE